MKLKVQGTEVRAAEKSLRSDRAIKSFLFFFLKKCIYGCYVHSAILPTFHRRCYWLLQNPDIVLVHYLNVPYPDDRVRD